MTTNVFHSAGHVLAFGECLTLLNAERLRDEVAADCIIACGAWRDAKEAGRALDAERAFFMRERLSAFENDLRRAIVECVAYRKPLGFSDPLEADERRVDVTGGDD
jgi:hypothetical protein